MRRSFHEQLDSLTAMLSNMCGLAGVAMDRATRSLLEADLTMAEQVITDHDELANLQTRAEEAVFALLALQAPVAGDLRLVFGSFQNVADAERMGALALHVAKIARRRHPDHALPDEVRGIFAEMGRIALNLSDSAKNVVLSHHPTRAAQISQDDDEMDQLHKELFVVLMDTQWKHSVAAAVDITLLGRFYERFADHAVAIGRRVVFEATGSTGGDRTRY
jgi:phosphate transport system protein